MAASISSQEPGRVSGQAKIDVLLVGDAAVRPLADTVQEFFSTLAEVTVTVGDVHGAVALLAQREFHLVFLRMASPAAGEREAARALRCGQKKNTHFLFVFIIPENFKGHGADITITEPLTPEKLRVVGRYWSTCFSHAVPVKSESSVAEEESGRPLPESCPEPWGRFSADVFACSQSPRDDAGLELKAPLSDFERSKRISLLHSSKEKLRRERIKHSCEQLRALVPGGRGRKNDAASVLEATVEHVRRVRDRIPPAVLGQITEALQSNRRFCKKQAPFQPPLPGPAMAPRESSVLASTHPPVREISFLANGCLNVHPAPAAGGPSDGAGRGPAGPSPERAAAEGHQGHAPSPAPSLSSFHAAGLCSTVVPAWDTAAAAATSPSEPGPLLPAPGPRASSGPAPPCSTALGQACAAPPPCLQSFWAPQ